MKHKLHLIIAALKVANQNRTWQLHVPITVRFSDFDFDLVEIHGLCVSPANELFLTTIQDGDGTPYQDFSPIEVTDKHADKLVDAIHARVFETYKQLEEAV